MLLGLSETPGPEGMRHLIAPCWQKPLQVNKLLQHFEGIQSPDISMKESVSNNAAMLKQVFAPIEFTALTTSAIHNNCHQVMNGDVTFTDTAFEHIVKILTSCYLLSFVVKSWKAILTNTTSWAVSVTSPLTRVDSHPLTLCPFCFWSRCKQTHLHAGFTHRFTHKMPHFQRNGISCQNDHRQA